MFRADKGYRLDGHSINDILSMTAVPPLVGSNSVVRNIPSLFHHVSSDVLRHPLAQNQKALAELIGTAFQRRTVIVTAAVLVAFVIAGAGAGRLAQRGTVQILRIHFALVVHRHEPSLHVVKF